MSKLSCNSQPVSQSSMLRRLVRGFFRTFGFQLVRIPQQGIVGGADKYYNTGRLTPMEENSVELNNSFYSDEAALKEYYGAGRLSFYADLSRHLQDIGFSLDGKSVLDVGCGVGYLLTSLKEWSYPKTVAGCDFSQAAVEYSRKIFPGNNFFVQDIYEPIPGTYDVVFCTEVLEHLLRPSLGLQNLLRAVEPGGVLVVTVPNGRLDNIIEHINFWSPESWGVFLESELPSFEIKTDTFRASENNIALITKPVQA